MEVRRGEKGLAHAWNVKRPNGRPGENALNARGGGGGQGGWMN